MTFYIKKNNLNEMYVLHVSSACALELLLLLLNAVPTFTQIKIYE